jgi:hypothetical protein
MDVNPPVKGSPEEVCFREIYPYHYLPGSVSTSTKMQTSPEDMKKILGQNEQVALYLPQKIYHPRINVDSVVLTNERIILRHTHALGLKKDYTDFNYGDISNVVLEKGITRSTIKSTLRLGGEPLALGDLPNSDAEKAYGIIRDNVARSQQSRLSPPAAATPAARTTTTTTTTTA